MSRVMGRVVGFVVGIACLTSVTRAQSSAARDSLRPAGSAVPAIVLQGRIDPKVDVNFSALVAPQQVYVGQQATYQIGVFLSEDARQRLRRNPEFVPPDVRSMVTYDLPAPANPLVRNEGGREYDVHVFQRALFPLTSGRHEIAAARLTYALPLSSSFFSREESHSARTASFTIIARDPPEAGKPSGYAGAVGRLSLAARVDTQQSRVGDPLTLTVSISGVGNVSLLPRPVLSVPWGETVAGAEHVTMDTTSALVQGRKDFEWVVTPKREGSVEIPQLHYPFWNPYTERYEVAFARAIPIRVAAGTLVATSAATTEPEPRLSMRKEYRGALSRPLSASPVFWIGMAVLPLPALALGASARPRRRRRASPFDEVERFAHGRPHSPSDLRRAVVTAISTRTALSAATLTDGRALVRALRREGVTTEGAHGVQRLLAELDGVVYGGSAATMAPDMAARALEALRLIDQEAKPVVRITRRASALALFVFSLSLGSAIVVQADEAIERARFDRGVKFYEQGFFDASMREFNDIVRRTPRAADAWANLGTAAWEANDTATAAIGWQRALRLEPLAEDVRGRLEQTPGFSSGMFGDVPPIPIGGGAILGALLWCTGWGMLAYSIRAKRVALHRPSVTAIVAAIVVGVGAVAIDEEISGRRRVVVVTPDALRASPALAADRAGEVLAGESARESGVQGIWTRLKLSDGRSGWIETRRIASLDVDRTP